MAIFDKYLQIPAITGHKRNKRQFLLLLLQFNTVFDRGKAEGANMQSNLSHRGLESLARLGNRSFTTATQMQL